MDDVLAKVDVPRRRFTVDEYYRMGDAGVFAPEERVELIEGEIALVWPQGNPILLPPRSVPQPDAALLRPRTDDYGGSSARPEDILLIVEVADTTYRYDRRVKVPLYARARLEEAWIIDLAHDVVEVYRRPARGDDEATARVERGHALTIAALPGIVLDVDLILPPA